MDYSNNHNSGPMESNSVSLAMFASVGFHAVLFVLMAFFPAASETVKKPLRIVNLLPPSQSPSTSPQQSQAKTSTLEDILQNPLPDLSAGFPPVGNVDSSSIQAAPDTSSYLGNNRSSFNQKVNTDNIKTSDIPTRSFPTTPSFPFPSPSSNQAKIPRSRGSSSIPPTPSGITPAPNTPIGQTGYPGANDFLPNPPNVVGAVPEPTGEIFPTPFPGVPSQFNQPKETPRKIPPSQQNIIPVISTAVPFSYPTSACPNALQGTATVTYYRKPDGTYVAGSGIFENSSGSPILDDSALTAVMNATAPGTGTYQRYSSRFDFVHSQDFCSQPESASGSPTSQPGSSPSSENPPSSGNESSENPSSENQTSGPSKSESKDIKPNPASNPSTPKTPKIPDGKVETPAIPGVDPTLKPNSDQKRNTNPDPVLPPKAEPINPSSTPVPGAVEPVTPKPAQPIEPRSVTPSVPEPSVPEPSAAPASQKPEGDATDLVPLEPVTPPSQPSAPKPSPAPEPPVIPAPEELKVPAPNS